MKFKFLVLISIFLAIALVAGCQFSIGTTDTSDSADTTDSISPTDDSDSTSSTDTSDSTSSTDSITLTTPTENTLVSAPLIIEGQAQGTWFFEASFPITLLDENNNVLAQTTAQAQGDWMTEDFVPFTAQIDSFSPGESTTGILHFQKDNPSGLPENDASFDLPVQFTPSASTGKNISIFFGNTEKNPEMLDCGQVYPVSRIIAQIIPVEKAMEATIQKLLKGPTETEVSEGYFTSINDNVTLQSLSINKNTVSVDFDKTLEQAVGGSCRVSAIRAQIEKTLLQFDGITQVQISINGQTEDILQP
ncbi:MAG: GerMN domain-containing protein [Candidatus Gracilibacteria bacterium]